MATKNKKLRQKKQPTYRHFKLSKKIRSPSKPLPGVLKLTAGAIASIRNNKKLFFGIAGIHAVFSLIFVTGLSSSFDFVQTKQQIEEVLGAEANEPATTLTLFGFLINSVGSSAGELSSTYQFILGLLASLAIIWAVRQVMADHKVSAKDAFYQGVYPLVPFLLVLFVVGLQLLPALIGTTLYSTILAGGLAVTSIEKIVWLILFVLSIVLSLYMVVSSVFALYIVTLPDMTPMKALRSARGLVLHRRLNIGLRMIALPLLLLVLSMIVLAPIILLVPWLAIFIFLIIGSLSLCLVHIYMYNLYRELL